MGVKYRKESDDALLYTFDYTGSTQSVTLPAGSYAIKVWGADGRDTTTPGGFTSGIIRLTESLELFIGVGGHGNEYGTGAQAGGWNGGGNAAASAGPGSSGGGATHVALMDGTLASIGIANASQILLVAGGGPGHAGGPAYLGCGGGLQSYGSGSATDQAAPATQSSGYAFGQGAPGEKAGAGGGWYGGWAKYQGQTGQRDCSGGSGHVGDYPGIRGFTLALRDNDARWETNPVSGSPRHGRVMIYQINLTDYDKPWINFLEPLTPSPTGNEWLPIATLADFQAMDATHNYYLTADIDGQGATVYNTRWGDYNAGRLGWFDGRGHTLKNFVVGTGGNANGLLGPVNCCNDPGEYSVQNVTLENITVLGGASNRSILFGTTGWVDNATVRTDPNNNKQAKYTGGAQCTRCRNITLKNCVVNGSGRYTAILVNNHRSPLYFENLAIIGQTGVNYMIDWEANSLGTLYIDKFYMNSPSIGNPSFSASAGTNPLVISNCYLKDASYTGMTTVTDADFTDPSTYEGFKFPSPWRMTEDGPITQMEGLTKLNAVVMIPRPIQPSPMDVEWIPIGTKQEFIDLFGDPTLGPYKNFYLTDDIDFEGDPFMPSWGWSIGRWGWFDGRNHKIKNIIIPSGYGQAQSGIFGAACGYNRGGELDTSGFTGEPEYSLQNLVLEGVIDSSGYGNENFVTGLACYKNGIDVNNGIGVVVGGAVWPLPDSGAGLAPHVSMRNVVIRNCDITDLSGNARICYLACIGNDSHGSIDMFDFSLLWESETPPVLNRLSGGQRLHIRRIYIDVKQYLDQSYFDNGSWYQEGYSKDFTVKPQGNTLVTDANFNLKSTYPTFDFDETWQMDEVKGPSSDNKRFIRRIHHIWSEDEE